MWGHGSVRGAAALLSARAPAQVGTDAVVIGPDPGFTLVQLRYFAAAAELGSMTAAAKLLMVSQSAVSTAVAQLERELGVQLLLRHHARGLTLTAAGQGFYNELRGFLVHGHELVEAARNVGDTLMGELSVGCFTTLGPFELPHLLRQFALDHPDVFVSVQEEEHAALKTALRSGTCELALMYGYDLEDDIEHVEIGAVPPYVLVGVEHRLAHRKRVSLAELATDPMVLLDLPHSSDYLASVVRSVGFDPVIRHRTAGYETVRALVAHGHGYAILNQRPRHDLTYDGSRVVSLAIRDRVEPLRIVLAAMRGVRLTRRARAFLGTSRRLSKDRTAC